MLAEKFILLIETLKSHASPDGSYPRVVSTSPHVAVKLPVNSFGTAQWSMLPDRPSSYSSAVLGH
jgi:hypothetical protein